MRKSIYLLIVGVVLVPTARADEKPYRPNLTPKSIRSLMDEAWYGMYLKDKKIGWGHEAFEEKDSQYHEFFELRMKLTSFGKKSEVTIIENRYFETKAPYRLTAADLTQKDGRQSTMVRLKLIDGVMHLTIQANSVVRKRKLPKFEFDLADSMATTLWIRTMPKVGTEIAHRSLDLFEGRTQIKKAKITARKTKRFAGVELKYVEVMDDGEQGKVMSQHKLDGDMLYGMVGPFELFREPEKLAKKTEFSNDLYRMGVTKIDRPLGDGLTVTELVIRAEGKGASSLESGPRQDVFHKGDKEAVVIIGKRWTKPVKATPMEIKKYLKDTTRYPINDPKIQALMKRAVGKAKTSKEKIRNITRFVFLYVEPKLTGVLPDIHELMTKKEGDCKSYALLTTVLARAAGIPARTVGGLVYMGDDEQAFSGHAWNEVVLDGEWVPIDASINETEINATHIRDERLSDTLGNLTFKLIHVKHRK